jgi:hypothetical protein
MEKTGERPAETASTAWKKFRKLSELGFGG